MADLNALIAQGAQFRVPPPVDTMGNLPQLMQMQSLQQQNQMNQMKMQESQRGQQEMNALRGIMSRPGFDLSTPQSQRDVYNVAPTLAENLIKGHLGNVKIMGEASNLKLTGQKLAIEAAAEKEKHLAQMYRDISGRPSDANITAHAEDVAASPLYTPEEKARVAAKAQSLLELPMADRTAMLSGQGISAGELSTAATARANQGVMMRGQDIVAGTAAAGQDVTRRGQDIVASTAKAGQGVILRGQDLVDARERQNIAIRQETQRRESDPAFKQQMAQATAMGQAIAKDQALAQQVLPKVLDTAQQTLSQIDTMIGKRDAEGNLLKGQAPHPGFANAVGVGFPGARFIPGTAAADFQSRFDQVKGGAFLQAFETLKGGGSISNVEGEKGTAALNRMNLAQSEKEFVNAAREFQGIVRKGVERAKVRVGGNAPAAAPKEVNFGDLK